MKTLLTEITIDAPPEEVWGALVDLAAYREWNPFIVEASGLAEEGSRLTLRMTPPGGRAATLKPTVTEATPGKAFEWLGRVGVPGLFGGRHRFELHPAEAGTLLVQRETFRGVLVPLLARSLDRHTLAGLVAMNEGLKRRSEKAAIAR
jgi:hypothetical protein